MGAGRTRLARLAVVRQQAGARAGGRGGFARVRARPPAVPRRDRGVRVASPRARRKRASRPAASVPVRILRQRRQPARRQHRHDGRLGRIAHHGTVPFAVSLPAWIMQKWLDGTVVNQKRWTETLFTLQVEADIARFEAGQFAKLALAVEGEMVARPYSFVNAPRERPHEFYYVTLPDGPLTQRLCKLEAGDAIYLAPRPAGFLVLSEIPDGEDLWLISTGTGVGPFLSILKTEGPWQRFKQVVLVHAVRYSGALTYRDRIEGLLGEHREQ